MTDLPAHPSQVDPPGRVAPIAKTVAARRRRRYHDLGGPTA
jgi:hypothetical protein